MTYIDYINVFSQWLEDDNPTDKAIVLYYGLLNTFNRRGWPRWAGVDTQRLMVLTRTTDKKVAYRARDSLVSAGFLEYRPGKKGHVTEYRLLKYCGRCTTENATENATKNATENATENATPNKTKTKIRNTPHTPKGAGVVSLPKYQPEWFERFWALYPRKTNRVAAVKAWDKLKPDFGLCKLIAAAIRTQMQSTQWQEGQQHIPHPSTWLNGARWLDEMDAAAQAPPAPRPKATYHREIINGEEVDVADV